MQRGRARCNPVLDLGDNLAMNTTVRRSALCALVRGRHTRFNERSGILLKDQGTFSQRRSNRLGYKFGAFAVYATILFASPDSLASKSKQSAPKLSPSITEAPIARSESATQADKAIEATDVIDELYAVGKKEVFWSAYGAPRELAYEALEVLQRAPEHGLSPDRYATDELYELIQTAQTDIQLKQFDRLLTAAIWTYSEDLRIGAAHEKVSRKKRANKLLVPVGQDFDKAAVKALAGAIVDDNLRPFLESLPPKFASYKELQGVLDTYTDYDLLGGWEKLPEDMHLKPGDEHPAVNNLRYRLIMTDGLAEEAVGSYVYDSQVQQAIQRFQQRHGLAVDGEIGPATLKTLNISSAEKVRRIGLNLARLRQLPKELPKDHIAVNIPEFKLRLIRDTEQALEMGVVVGSRRTPTPAMQDKMRHLVFNPYWYPPHNITVREILPKLRRDPEYLQRSGFELLRGKTVVDGNKINWKEVSARRFPFRVRQVPGEKNALGAVKFIFPNKQAIYLHDTPQQKLFGERVRAFSHGCVRLEKPKVLASALMNWDRGWSEDDVLADITAEKRKLRKFKERMAIYLLYQTASIVDGVINFHPDIYGHDRSVAKIPEAAPLVAKVLVSPDGPEQTNQRVATL